MPKPKARPHSRQGSSTSVVRLAGLTRVDSTQRLDRVVVAQPPSNLNISQLPPKKTKQQGRQAQQSAIQQPASRKHANGGGRQAAVADDDSDEDGDAWESSESGAVTPNPDPADLEHVDQATLSTDGTAQAVSEPNVTPRTEHPEPLLATPKPVLKLSMPPVDQEPPPLSSATPVTATTATITREAPAGPTAAAAHNRPAHQLPYDKVPVLLASPAIQSELRPQQEHPPPRRARPQSAIFPAGAGMTPLNPDRDLQSQRRRGSAHTIDEPVGMSSRKSRPVSVHSLVGLPSRPHPLLRGISHSGMATPTTSIGPLLNADPAHALLSPTLSSAHIPRSTPSSPGSSHAAPATGGGLFRRKSVSSIKSVATLPATSSTTAVSDLNPTLSTSPGSHSVSGTTAYDSRHDSAAAGRLRQHTASALDILQQTQAANKAGGKVGAVRSSEPPANRLVVTFAQARALDPFRSNRRAAPHPLLSEEAMARHVAVTQFVDPGLASLERVLGLRGPLSVPTPSRTASKLRG
ncbi:hypothetical protein BKA62DRAFT_13228 [Auriculariales sp. MPI-PUGE-AT-0066]|nr:hypothetical protein BKA62DRAFT_13228 [Auriculariales sp. MPI-PUGE-AT-0066]